MIPVWVKWSVALLTPPPSLGCQGSLLRYTSLAYLPCSLFLAIPDWSDQSNSFCLSRTVKQISKFRSDQINPFFLCPKEGIEESLREGKLFPLETVWTVSEQNRGFCRCWAQPADKGWATGVCLEVLGTIHLGATAEQFHWDLKKTAGRQSPYEFTFSAMGGLLQWLRRRWMLSECEMRWWQWLHMHDSAPFHHFPFHSPYSCLCLRMW